MKTKFIIFLFLSNLFFGCRYKENEFLSLRSVKNRICGTWVVIDCFDKSTGLNLSINKAYSIKINFISKQSYSVESGYYNNIGKLFTLLGNKKYVSIGESSGSKDAKIIKLTSKELWIEGFDVFNSIGGGYTSLLIKYKRK